MKLVLKPINISLQTLTKVSIVLNLLVANASYGSTIKQTSLSAIKALIPGISSSKNMIRTHGCAYQKEKWLAIILTKEPFTEVISYNKDCDIAGKYTVKMDQYFPVKLTVKNQKEIKSISGKLKFEVVFEDQPLLKIQMQDMLLKSTKDIKFNLSYGVYLNPMDANPLQNHKGGELFVRSIGSKKIYKRFPLDAATFK